MVSLATPLGSCLTRQSPPLTVGVDNGAGLVKVVMGSGSAQMRLRTLAKVYEVRGELDDVLTSKEGGHFFYHDGERKELVAREFLTGSVAAWKAPATHIKLSDDPSLKAEYCLHTLLGTLGTLPHRQEWHLYLVLSIHAKQFREALAQKVRGMHVVSFNGKTNPTSRIHLNVSLVAPEGAGSYLYCTATKPEPLIDRTAHVISVDFGTSTVIPTVFAPGGKIVHRKVLEVGGCIDLIDAIAGDSDLIAHLGKGKAGSVESVRKAIEAKTFQYGTRGFNFKNIYARYLTSWLEDRLRLVDKEVEEWRDEAQSFVAWGGGVEMPGVAQKLTERGITPVADACWANAIGLQRMAEGRLARGN